MRIAIFGGSGFVGSYIIDEMLARDIHPVILVRPNSKHKLLRSEDCTLVYGDIHDDAAIEKTLTGADGAIFNIGILREFPARGITFEKLQFEAAKRSMNAAVRQGAERFLLMSANGVRSDGTDYQKTKYMAEQYLATTTLDWTVFQPSVIFGNPRGQMEFASQLYHDIIRPPLPAPLFYRGLFPFDAGNFELAPVHVMDVAKTFLPSSHPPPLPHRYCRKRR